MTDARDFLNRILVQPAPEPRKPPRQSISTCIEQHTLEWLTAEAEAKNVTPGVWIRLMLELLESGEF